MKWLGLVIFSIGAALLIFVLYNYYRNSQTLKSPVPQDKGIKVIFISPTK